MGDVKYTEEQQAAIDILDKSVLVSAAAGSGKTAVLVERVINIVLEGKADVDEMLVVTFTNAAASELRLKLTKAIKKRMAETNSNDEQQRLKVQLDKMYRAYVCTFNSFALRIVKEFFYMTDIEPSAKIIDDTQAQIMKNDAMDAVFEQGFSRDDFIEGYSFRDFLLRYSNDYKKEDRLIEEMIGTYNKLRSMPDYFEWALEAAERLNTGDNYRDSYVYKIVEENVSQDLKKMRASVDKLLDFLDENDLVHLYQFAEDDKESIEEKTHIFETKGICEEFFNIPEKNRWKTFRMPSKGVSDQEKDTWERLKVQVDDIRKGYKETSNEMKEKYAYLDTRFTEMNDAYKYTKYYIEILIEFEKEFSRAKRDLNVLDFADCEHIAYNILSDEKAASIIKDRFKYIFIDEYQDTNPLQESLIRKIQRSGNVFKVGDVKQSIYGFRQSEPAIFIETRDEYISPENQDAVVIDLNKNFRSSAAVINYVNAVFEDIMPGYDDSARLYCGLKNPDGTDMMPEVHLLLKNKNSDRYFDEDIDVLEGESVDIRQTDDIEAEYVANLVKNIIGMEFYDSKAGVVRRATARDIVILLRATRSKGSKFYKALQDKSVPAYLISEGEYFDTVEVKVAMALLSVIDNMQNDIPLIAVLRSEVFNFSPEELGEIRAFYKEADMSGSYSEALLYYSSNGEGDLCSKVNGVLEKIYMWRAKSSMMPLDDFIWYVLNDSEYYLYAGAMAGGRQRQANLRALTDRAKLYKSSGVSSLSDYLRYLDVLKSKKVELPQATLLGEDDDVVRIMTMHKSKGLEFPFVIIPSLGSELNTDKESMGMMLDRKTGLSVAYVDVENKAYRNTLMQDLIKEAQDRRSDEEEKRLLYVSMTRAREKLILTGVKKVSDKGKIEKNRSFFQMMDNVLDTPFNVFEKSEIGLENSSRNHNNTGSFINAVKDGKIKVDQELSDEISRRLDYEYSFDERKLKGKYSVSEIRRREIEKSEDIFRSVSDSWDGKQSLQKNKNVTQGDRQVAYDEAFAPVEEAKKEHLFEWPQENKGIKAVDIGTGYHRIMEHLNFISVLKKDGSIDKKYVDDVVNELVSKEAVKEEILKRIDIRNIYSFFESEIGARAIKAAREGRLKKEKTFTLKTEYDGSEILVQGIIDCCFEEDGHWTLIDYKSNRLNWSNIEGSYDRIRQEYEPQIRIYKEAIEKGTGMPVTESYLYLFSSGEFLVM